MSVNRKETNETNCVLLLFYFGKDKSTAIQEEKKASGSELDSNARYARVVYKFEKQRSL
jgi:hypothetical protein